MTGTSNDENRINKRLLSQCFKNSTDEALKKYLENQKLREPNYGFEFALSEFESSLSENQEIVIQQFGGGNDTSFHLRTVEKICSDLIQFTGVSLDGNNVVLIQHPSQLNLLLLALKPLGATAHRVFARD